MKQTTRSRWNITPAWCASRSPGPVRSSRARSCQSCGLMRWQNSGSRWNEGATGGPAHYRAFAGAARFLRLARDRASAVSFFFCASVSGSRARRYRRRAQQQNASARCSSAVLRNTAGSFTCWRAGVKSGRTSRNCWPRRKPSGPCAALRCSKRRDAQSRAMPRALRLTPICTSPASRWRGSSISTRALNCDGIPFSSRALPLIAFALLILGTWRIAKRHFAAAGTGRLRQPSKRKAARKAISTASAKALAPGKSRW
jgi:hypothetical protein